MDFCPNCNNEICANGFMTHILNVFDLMSDPNPVEMKLVDERFFQIGFINNDYIDKLRKPRRIPRAIPKRLPDISDFDFFNQESFQSITVTCKKSPWIFQYSEEFDIEVLDN